MRCHLHMPYTVRTHARALTRTQVHLHSRILAFFSSLVDDKKLPPLSCLGTTLDHKSLGFPKLKDFLFSRCSSGSIVSEDDSDSRKLRHRGISIAGPAFALAWKQDSNDYLVSLKSVARLPALPCLRNMGDCVVEGRVARAKPALQTAQDPSHAKVAGVGDRGIEVRLRGGGSGMLKGYASIGSDSNSDSLTSSLLCSNDDARPLPSYGALNDDLMGAGPQPKHGDLDTNREERSGLDPGRENWRCRLNASEWWSCSKKGERAARARNAVLPQGFIKSEEVEGPQLLDLSNGEDLRCQDHAGHEPSHEGIGWGRGTIEDVEDMSAPEEKDGSVRVVPDIDPPPPRPVREELVDTSKYKAVDPACKRRVLQMQDGIDRDLLEDMICIKERIALLHTAQTSPVNRAQAPCDISTNKTAESAAAAPASFPTTHAGTSAKSDYASGHALKSCFLREHKTGFAETALPLREMEWRDVCSFLHALDIDGSVIDIIEHEKVPGPQLAQMSLADLMQDLKLSKLQARRVMAHLDLRYPWQQDAAQVSGNEKTENPGGRYACDNLRRSVPLTRRHEHVDIDLESIFEQESRDLAAAYAILGIPEHDEETLD